MVQRTGEGLAVINAFRRYIPILLQHKFELRCDANGLCYIMTSEKRQSTVDLWAFEVSTLDFDVSFTPGDQLTLADALSRLRTDLAERDAEVDLDSREKAQERLPEERMHYNKKRKDASFVSSDRKPSGAGWW